MGQLDYLDAPPGYGHPLSVQQLPAVRDTSALVEQRGGILLRDAGRDELRTTVLREADRVRERDCVAVAVDVLDVPAEPLDDRPDRSFVELLEGLVGIVVAVVAHGSSLVGLSAP
jgi:hypothetical protein